MAHTGYDAQFGPSLLQHRAASIPDAAILLDHLRQRCDTFLRPGDDDFIDCVERASPWWAISMRQTGSASAYLIPFVDYILDDRPDPDEQRSTGTSPSSGT
jgi:hypothetical protein